MPQLTFTSVKFCGDLLHMCERSYCRTCALCLHHGWETEDEVTVQAVNGRGVGFRFVGFSKKNHYKEYFR